MCEKINIRVIFWYCILSLMTLVGFMCILGLFGIMILLSTMI